MCIRDRFGIVHLRNLLACFGTIRQSDMIKTQGVKAFVCQTHLSTYGNGSRYLLIKLHRQSQETLFPQGSPHLFRLRLLPFQDVYKRQV